MADEHRELVEHASQGDRTALDRLVARHLPALLAYVRLHAGAELRAREASADIVQSACREVLADVGAMRQRDEAHFRHWMFVAVERKIVDRARFHARARRDARQDVALEADASEEDVRLIGQGLGAIASPSQAAIARETLGRVLAAFERLPEEYRRVIVLSRIVGLSHADVARELRSSETAVRSLLHRALARLAREMGPV